MAVEAMKSRLLVGQVRHRRFAPVQHRLSTGLFMMAIDPKELKQLSQEVRFFGQRWWHPARFKRGDYIGQQGDITQAVFAKIGEITGDEIAKGRVMMVCHLRYWGLYFSPVNFYYVYDQEEHWQYLVAEVSNTPWLQRHYYVLKVDPNQPGYWQHEKAFHVSPFNPIEQTYDWQVRPLDERLLIQLSVRDANKIFDATLALKAQPFDSRHLGRLLLKTPWLTLKVLMGIYIHAWRLWRKGATYYPNPHADQ
ncbi:hypothetical protein VST7929_02864 [Vibrio stylophorae]|uniref:DUF1365 domain-containing protein n=1 Tax=Vibrio stylophorae TaxID=659351 RepID=A0ABN8DVT9_9VIBR|nr:DUF1365 domain-containing protein [Vibrio stylophorae]CAH0535203.1 hypothetical protein VST7929_02864 [Vibrio stylophorae]